MTDRQIIGFISEVIMALWPDCDINKEQLRPWTKALRRFDYDIARLAAEEHYASPLGQYKQPKLFAIIEKARALTPRTNRKESVHFEPDVFVQCVENEKVGQFFAIIPPARFYNDRDYIMKAAERTRRKAEACYSGRWVTIQQTSYTKLRDQLINCRTKYQN
ncbi:MAG: hypothetical protein JW804_08575 [Sedimentisphaerales bacterium]|nr:hypothetical protein [Sedimentisphaerales bacterium]